MSPILDEQLTENAALSRCKRLRFYVLIFSGIMACIALIFNLLNFPHQHIFLLLGMIAITFQSHYCFYHRPHKKWKGLFKVILITSITAVVIIYILLPSFR